MNKELGGREEERTRWRGGESRLQEMLRERRVLKIKPVYFSSDGVIFNFFSPRNPTVRTLKQQMFSSCSSRKHAATLVGAVVPIRL